MAKMGRPPLEEPMTYKVSVRFNDREYQRLKANEKAINKTKTEDIKDGIELLYEKESRK